MTQRTKALLIGGVLLALGGGLYFTRELWPRPSYLARMERLAASISRIDRLNRTPEKILTILPYDPESLIEPLISLLASGDTEVRITVANFLNNRFRRHKISSQKLPPDALPKLIAAFRSGLEIENIIGMLDTAEGAEFLVEQVLRENRRNSRFISSLRNETGLKTLARKLTSSVPMQSTFLHVCRRMFEPIDGLSAPAEVLLSGARSTEAAIINRKSAIALLGVARTGDSTVIEQLKELSLDLNPEISVTATQALLQIEHFTSVESRLARAEMEVSSPDLSSSWNLKDDLIKFAQLRERATAAGPLLQRLIRHEDWDLRVQSVIALGHVGYAAAESDLIALLDNKDDYALVNEAAKALARLNAKAALPHLERVARDHWLESTRLSAADCVAALQGKFTVPDLADEGIRREFFDFEDTTPTPTAIAASSRVEFTDFEKSRRRANKAFEKLQGISFSKRIDTVSCILPGDTLPVTLRQEPVISRVMRMKNGWLLGQDQGEFGGGVFFLGDDGAVTSYAHEVPNVISLHKTTHGVVIVANAAMTHIGRLYLATENPSGPPSVKMWKRLPWDPGDSEEIGLRENGELYVAGVIVTTTGELKLAK